jgi:dienelactone hydrolase
MQVNKWSAEVPEFLTPGDKTVFVWEPESEGPFPIISFAHGKGGGGQGLQEKYNAMATSIAQEGYIVVA